MGTGQALTMGKEGEADVLLVHAPASEIEVVESGAAINRQLVMHNDFVVAGPASDPAGIKGLSAAESFEAIQTTESLFVSRGDDSGTHKKELAIWKAAGVTLPGPDDAAKWYQETGSGMGATLTQASEKQAYVLTDRGTYLSLLLDGSVIDNVVLGQTLRGKSQGAKENALKWLARFGIEHLSPQMAHTLSGGEAQRASLARAFALEPEVLLMDEPFSSVDNIRRQGLIGAFREVRNASRTTTLLVTHDFREVLALADRVLVLSEGKPQAQGTSEEIARHPIWKALASVDTYEAAPEQADHRATQSGAGIGT